MVTIVDGNLRHTIWETVYDALVSAHLGSSTATITANFIDNTPIFPQVVVNNIIKSQSDKTIGSSPSFNKFITLSIDLYAKKKEHIDLLSDEIDNTIFSLTIPGVDLKESNSSDGEGRDINGNKFHIYSLTYSYLRRS